VSEWWAGLRPRASRSALPACCVTTPRMAAAPASHDEWVAAPYAAAPSTLAGPDASFISQFEARSLPFEEWTHQAHLRMATIQLVRHGCAGHGVKAAPESVEARVRDAFRSVVGGIQRFNGAHSEKLRVGFHHTITEVWFRMVLCALADALAAGADASLPGSDGLVAAIAGSSVDIAGADGSGSARVPLASSGSMFAVAGKDELFGDDGSSRSHWVQPTAGRLVPAAGAEGLAASLGSLVVRPASLLS